MPKNEHRALIAFLMDTSSKNGTDFVDSVQYMKAYDLDLCGMMVYSHEPSNGYLENVLPR